MTSELKQCRECKSDRVTCWNVSGGNQIICKDCKYVSGVHSNEDDARNEWNTRAAPDVPELVRLAWSMGGLYQSETGFYTDYGKAAKIIAAEQQKTKDAEELAFRMDRFAQKYLSHMRNAEQRSEAAEAKLAQYEAQHEKEIKEVIKERDQCEAWADKLAYAIGGEAIGEHSNMNSPWANALEIAASPAPAADLKAENEKLREAIENTNCPRPCNGRPDDTTVKQCTSYGECACVYGSALKENLNV